MFKHLLLPTDGSTASEVAIRQAMALAKENQAKVTGLHVVQPFQSVTDEHPYEGIIRTAKTRRCDLIAMSAHGRGGLKSLLLGSTTQKVLAHSTLPVLMLR